jgi:hypothetical protein
MRVKEWKGDLPLFSAARRRAEPAPPPESVAEALLRETRPDELTRAKPSTSSTD